MKGPCLLADSIDGYPPPIQYNSSSRLPIKHAPMSLPRLLVIDDVIDNIEILVAALSKSYDVRFATSGKEGLSLANSSEPPDLILLDVMMPEMDGYETCRLLKENPATLNIPVIFVTAKASVADRQHGLALGAIDYIAKPFELALLHASIRNHLRVAK